MKSDSEGNIEYALVPDEDESTPLSGLGEKTISDRPSKRSSSHQNPNGTRLFYIACFGSLICSIFNLFFLAINGQGFGFFSSNVPLERPNIYINLDKLPANVTLPSLPLSLDVFPPLFQPVDKSDVLKVYPDDGHARFTFNGRVSPGDHHIILTPKISMIAQYRVRDYGMERCAIVSTILDRETLHRQRQNLTLRGDTSNIEVWNLTSAGEIDVNRLSWATKPNRGRLLGRFSVAEGQTSQTEDFDCGSSGSLQSFELVCTGPDCLIDFWQDIYFKPRFGIYVLQQPSL